MGKGTIRVLICDDISTVVDFEYVLPLTWKWMKFELFLEVVSLICYCKYSTLR